jgi:2-methylcitrate dehydratase PrpD
MEERDQTRRLPENSTQAYPDRSATNALAQLAAGIEIDSLPGQVIEVAGQCLTDFIAVAAPGPSMEPSDPVVAAVSSVGDNGAGSVIGRDFAATARSTRRC